MSELWEQQAEEPHRAFAAFVIYRDLPGPERSLPNAYRKGTGAPTKLKVSSQWRTWAERYHWEERARAYDRHLDYLRRHTMEQEVVKAQAEHARTLEISSLQTLQATASLAYVNITDIVEWDKEGGLRIKD